MNAAWPPIFCACAITCSVMVVLPPDSGPKISTTRPRGNPPTPSAASRLSDPLGITLTGTSTSRLPKRMIAPLPYCFSICAMAASRTLLRSSAMVHLERDFAAGECAESIRSLLLLLTAVTAFQQPPHHNHKANKKQIQLGCCEAFTAVAPASQSFPIVNTYKSRGRISCPASLPPPSFSAAGKAGTSDRQSLRREPP